MERRLPRCGSGPIVLHDALNEAVWREAPVARHFNALGQYNSDKRQWTEPAA